MNQNGYAEKWVLILYVASMTPAARRALHNVKAICDLYLKEEYSLQVIDLMEQPALAEADQIFAVPTLVRKVPGPLRKIIGDLGDSEQVLVGLGLTAAA